MGHVQNDPQVKAIFERLVAEFSEPGKDMVVHVGHQGDGRVVLVVHNAEDGIATTLDWKGAAWTACSLMLHGYLGLVSEGLSAEEAWQAMWNHFDDSQKRQIEEVRAQAGQS